MLTLRSKVKIIWFGVNMEHILPKWKNRQKPVNIERFPDSQKSKCSMLFLLSVSSWDILVLNYTSITCLFDMHTLAKLILFEQAASLPTQLQYLQADISGMSPTKIKTSTWRIIPLSKWLITMVILSPLKITLWDPIQMACLWLILINGVWSSPLTLTSPGMILQL